MSQLPGEQLNKYLAKIRDLSNLIKGPNVFPLQPNKLGVSRLAVQAMTSVVDTHQVYSMVSVETEGKAQLVVQLAFSADLRHMWVRAWRRALASTTGYGKGSKLFCALRNLLVAFTIAEKQSLLAVKAAFWYLEAGFEATWLALKLFFLRSMTML